MTDNDKRYDKKQIKEQYDKFYESGDFTRFPIADRKFIDALLSKYVVKQEPRILDVACGTGKYSKHLHDSETAVLGIDISRKAIEIASRTYPQVNFVQGDAMNPPVPEQYFDMIFCHGFSLFNEDLENTREYMETSAKYINENGLFVFGKTSMLTDEMSESGSRMDHSLQTFEEFFMSISDFEVLEAHATIPHTFIPLGRYGFSNIITELSIDVAKRLKIPLRVYVILRKKGKTDD